VARLDGHRDGHGIQADRGRPGTLARRQGTHLVALVRAGARFECGKLVERDSVFEATQAAADTPVQAPAASDQPVSKAA
jgi:hypothetical protein